MGQNVSLTVENPFKPLNKTKYVFKLYLELNFVLITNKRKLGDYKNVVNYVDIKCYNYIIIMELICRES